MPLNRVETVMAEGPGAAHNHVVSGDRALLRAPRSASSRRAQSLLPPESRDNEGLYKRKPTLTGIARVLRNRGLAGLARECNGASERAGLPKSETARSQSTLR